jgi:hypothetical protein
MRKKKNKGAFWRQLNAIAPNSVRMSLSECNLSAYYYDSIEKYERTERRGEEGGRGSLCC